MSGALVGFRIDGEKKLLRLHGERNCEGVLTELLASLRRFSDDRLRAYARTLRLVEIGQGLFPDEAAQAAMQDFTEDHFGESYRFQTWAEAFAEFPDLEAWHAGFPFMPAASIDACGDVIWGFLIDLDAGELQIFVNRNKRFLWREMACPQPAYCTLSLAHARLLTPQDLGDLHKLLHQHSYSDGIDPVLPLRDLVSERFPGPGGWHARLQLAHGRVRLLLERGPITARIRQVGELKLDDPHCGALLQASLAPPVLALALGIYGPAASLGQVALVATHLEQLPFGPEEGGLPLLDLGLRASSGLGLPLGAGFFDAVRACFLAVGMSAQGWRFLIKQNNAVLRFILQFFPPSARILRDFARYINLLASAMQHEPLLLHRCQPALRGVERVLDRTRGRPGPVREENARVFLRAIMRARLSAEDEANLPHDAQDVSDFVYSHATVLKGVTWASLCRRSDAWHRALLITVDPEKDVRWPALLPQYASGPVVAVELDTGSLLAEEGLEQRHCIGTYVNACASGATRVFSLRRNGKRMATIELQRNHDGSWRMVQIRGKANTVVHDMAALDAAQQVAQAYSEAAQSYVPASRPRSTGNSIHTGQPSYLIHRQEHWTG
ncbi:MAG: PcfJ domain-containing protein [Curvibacter sp.]